MRKKIERIIRRFYPGTYENLLSRQQEILRTYQYKERLPDVVVSLTTYEKRIKSFEYAILSIIGGSKLPEAVHVYVPQGFVDRLRTQHTSILSDVYQTGFVRLIEMPEDYFCHSKYYYSFLEFGEEKDIVLCDDDVVYHKNWLNGLWQAAQQYQDVQVIAYQALEITHKDGCIEPYDNWRFCRGREVISDRLLYAEAVAGVFYRRNSMRKETLNKEVFLSITPKADDVWLCFCSYYNQSKLMQIPTGTRLKTLFVIPDTQEMALWKENTIAKRNDRYIQAVHQYFCEQLNMNILQQDKFICK